MSIVADKKRVSLSLTKKTVADFQAITKEMGFNQSIMSVVCEEALMKTIKVFQLARDRGGLGLVDLFHMVGEEMESIDDANRMLERKKEGFDDKKGKIAPKGKKRIKP